MGKYHLTKDRLYQLDALTYYPYLGHLLIVVIATFVDSIKGKGMSQDSKHKPTSEGNAQDLSS